MTYVLLGFPGVVQSRSLYQEHGYLLFNGHALASVELQNVTVERLAIPGIHNVGFEAFRTRSPAISQACVLVLLIHGLQEHTHLEIIDPARFMQTDR